LLAIFAALTLCGTGFFAGVGVVGAGVVGVGVVGTLDGAGVVIPGDGAGVVLGVVGVYLVGDGFLDALQPVKDIDNAIINAKSIKKIFLLFFNSNTSNQYFAQMKSIYYNIQCKLYPMTQFEVLVFFIYNLFDVFRKIF
jgi:hypothetical protein